MKLSGKKIDDALFYNHNRDDLPDQQEFVTHAHDLYEILYFVSGRGTYLVESTA